MNFTQLNQGQILTNSFEYKNQKYFYSIENLGSDEDFDGENAYRLTFDFAKYSQDFEARDIDEAVKSLTDLIDYKTNQNEERKIISFRIPVTVLEDLKKIAKSQGLPYQTLMNQILFLYTQNNKN